MPLDAHKIQHALFEDKGREGHVDVQQFRGAHSAPGLDPSHNDDNGIGDDHAGSCGHRNCRFQC